MQLNEENIARFSICLLHWPLSTSYVTSHLTANSLLCSEIDVSNSYAESRSHANTCNSYTCGCEASITLFSGPLDVHVKTVTANFKRRRHRVLCWPEIFMCSATRVSKHCVFWHLLLLLLLLSDTHCTWCLFGSKHVCEQISSKVKMVKIKSKNHLRVKLLLLTHDQIMRTCCQKKSGNLLIEIHLFSKTGS